MQDHFAYRAAFFYSKGRNLEKPKVVITPESFAADHYHAYLKYMTGFNSNYKCVEDYYEQYIESLNVFDELVNSK